MVDAGVAGVGSESVDGEETGIERAAQAAGVLRLVLRIETREHVAGTLVDEMDEAEIPAGDDT